MWSVKICGARQKQIRGMAEELAKIIVDYAKMSV